jgi:hypothetical protein
MIIDAIIVITTNALYVVDASLSYLIAILLNDFSHPRILYSASYLSV